MCLSAADVRELLTLEDAIPLVRDAFASYARGDSAVYPVVREPVLDGAGMFGIKSGYFGDRRWLGLKAGGFWAGNRQHGLAAHQSVILLFDPSTGVLQAVVDANYITMIRTGAVGAIAAAYLARPDARIAAVVGCGVQGQIQTRALKCALPLLREVRCYDASAAAIAEYVAALGDLGLSIRPAPTERDAVYGADVVVTTTPSWQAHVMSEWVRDDAHVSAIGADTRGKMELDVDLFRRARLVVDDWAQASQIGESQHAFQAGIVAGPNAELGDICAGRTSGRGDYGGVTIFDATGIALQDLAAAGRAVELAEARGRTTTIRL